jgi:mannose/fructose/N-acetylgalactosamine-specific phosphotransferase system component IIB
MLLQFLKANYKLNQTNILSLALEKDKKQVLRKMFLMKGNYKRFRKKGDSMRMQRVKNHQKKFRSQSSER